jgi:hypothetical protein
MNLEQAQALRAPFANDLIETRTIAGRSISYLNHAIVTDRLIQVDPNWSWEPMGINLDGTPVIDGVGGLWIRLTLCESTRIGYGASDAHQKGADAIKSAISDAIKNAAMRFGVALDLWGVEPSALAEVPPKPIERLTIVPGIMTPDNEPWNDPIEDTDDLFHPSCKHGLMNYKSGTSSTGKKWEGYFCSFENKTLQCATIGMNGQPWRK